MTEAAPGAAGGGGAPGGAAAGGGSPMSERMQVLLSRAVEDQLSEQRQLTTALADIRALLVRLPEEVRAATAGAIGDQGEGVRAEVDGIARELRAGLQALGERLDAVAQGGASDLDARLAAVETAVSRQAERLEQLAAQDHDELLSRLDALSDRLVALDERSAGAPDVAGEIRSAVDELGRTLIGAQVSATDLESAVRLVVPEVVTTAHANTERRLAAHVDEAVLALAEALLRRRPTRTGIVPEPGDAVSLGGGYGPLDEPDVPAAPDWPAPVAAEGTAVQSTYAEVDDGSIVERLDLDRDHEMEELAESSGEEPPLVAESAAEPEPADSQSAEPEPAEPESAQAQVAPQTAQSPIRPAVYPRPAEQPRRRPWWRPGD